jgi:hypothetical protein
MPTTPDMARQREGSMGSFAGGIVFTPTIVNLSPVHVAPPQELGSMTAKREVYELSAELPSRMPSRRGRESRATVVTEIEIGDTPDTSPTERTR